MILQLPAEVTSHIIQLSLPRPSFASFRERADLLLSYSLVNRTWRDLARQDLYRHLVIGTPEAVESWIKALEQDGAAVGGRATSLRMGTSERKTWSFEDDKLVSSIIQRLPNLVEFWARGVGRLDLSSLATDKIRTLHLHFSNLSPLRGPAFNLDDCRPFPSLRTLSLGDPRPHDLIHLLQSAHLLPTLEILHLVRVRDYDHVAEDLDSGPTIGDLAPQLQSLSIKLDVDCPRCMVNLLNFFIRRCTALANLRIAGRDQLKLLSSGLTTPIRHLWIRTDLDYPFRNVGDDGAEPLTGNTIAEALQNRNAGVNLSTLQLHLSHLHKQGILEVDLVELEEICGARGINLTESCEEMDAINTWEKVVELDWE